MTGLGQLRKLARLGVILRRLDQLQVNWTWGHKGPLLCAQALPLQTCGSIQPEPLVLTPHHPNKRTGLHAQCLNIFVLSSHWENRWLCSSTWPDGSIIFTMQISKFIHTGGWEMQ